MQKKYYLMMIEIEDKAIIIAISDFRDSMKIISCFTKKHGLLKGVLRVNKDHKKREPIFVGNIVHIVWSARLEEHLGKYNIEIENNVLSKIILDKEKIYVLNCVIELLKMILNERESHQDLFEYLNSMIEDIIIKQDFSTIIVEYCIFEMKLLESAGYGLSLSKCVVKQTADDLYYISPRSGAAVSRIVGEPYHEKLFIIPEFLISDFDVTCFFEVQKSINITEYFFKKHFRGKFNNKVQEVRNRLKKLITTKLES